MAKKNKNKVEAMQPEFEEDSCDFNACFSTCHDSMEREALINAYNFQSSLAYELTKLIVANATSENKTEESILDSFVHASKAVRENSLLKVM